LSSASTITPFSRGFPVAGSNRDGIPFRKPRERRLALHADDRIVGPVIPASVR
jgi:hypothetical protein